MILISFIVTVYNKQKYIKRCIDSLLKSNENYEYEIIIIDDGSTDNSGRICDRIALHNNCVRVIHKENSGVSAARNEGINLSQGKWITFIDGDDYVEPCFFNELKSAIYNYSDKCDLIFFNGFGDTNNHIVKNEFFLKENVDYSSSEKKVLLEESAISLGIIPKGYKHFFSLGGACCKLIRKKCLIDNHVKFNTTISFAEDVLFSLELISVAKGIFYYDQYLYHYYQNQDSAIHRYRKDLSINMNDFFSELNKWVVIHKSDRIVYAYYLRAFVEAQRCIRNYFYHKDNKINYSKRKKLTNAFLSRYPYSNAIHFFLFDNHSLVNRIKANMLYYNMFNIYILAHHLFK